MRRRLLASLLATTLAGCAGQPRPRPLQPADASRLESAAHCVAEVVASTGYRMKVGKVTATRPDAEGRTRHSITILGTLPTLAGRNPDMLNQGGTVGGNDPRTTTDKDLATAYESVAATIVMDDDGTLSVSTSGSTLTNLGSRGNITQVDGPMPGAAQSSRGAVRGCIGSPDDASRS